MNRYLEKIASDYQRISEEEATKAHKSRIRKGAVGGAVLGGAFGHYMSRKEGLPRNKYLKYTLGSTSLFSGMGAALASDINPPSMDTYK